MTRNTIILLPDNGRSDPKLTLNRRGEQVGTIRIFTHRLVDGESVPDLTYVMSEGEHRRMMAQKHPSVGRHYFGDRFYGETRS